MTDDYIFIFESLIKNNLKNNINEKTSIFPLCHHVADSFRG